MSSRGFENAQHVTTFAVGMVFDDDGTRYTVQYVDETGCAHCTLADNTTGSLPWFYAYDIHLLTLDLNSIWVGRPYRNAKGKLAVVSCVTDTLVGVLFDQRVQRLWYRVRFLAEWKPLPLDHPAEPLKTDACAKQLMAEAPPKQWTPEVGKECEWFADKVMEAPVRVTPMLYDEDTGIWVIREYGTAIYHGVKVCVLRPLPPEPDEKISPPEPGSPFVQTTAKLTEKPTTDDYLRGHKASGIKVGDRVKVVRKAESHEGGWDTTWDSPEMDVAIGREFEVTEDGELDGFMLKTGDTDYDEYYFPYFVLAKVHQEAQPEPWKPTPDDECLYLQRGGIRVVPRYVMASRSWVVESADFGKDAVAGYIVATCDLRPLPPEPPVTDTGPIFSGSQSVEMWDKINKATTVDDLRYALYAVCCKLQQLESKLVPAAGKEAQR